MRSSAFPVAWLAAFLFFTFSGSTAQPPAAAVFPLLAITGLAWHFVTARPELRELLARHVALFAAAALLSACITASELAALLRGDPSLAGSLPAQVWLPLCLPALVLMLRDPVRLRAATWVLVAVCAWHFVALPLEGSTGLKVPGLGGLPVARDAGPFHFQASGLAAASYLAPGLLLPVFYLAFGPWAQGELRGRRAWPAFAWPLLTVLWLAPVAAVQSRSAFAGAAAAALLAVAARPGQRLDRKVWALLAALTLIAALTGWALFADNKSGAGLRLAYLRLFLEQALQWPTLLFGHGAAAPQNELAIVAGAPALLHSHNDLVQLLYSSGVFTVAAYVAFWVALLRLVAHLYARQGATWPLCTVVAFLPNTLTDVGYHQFEKAAFLVLFAAWCVVFERAGDAPGPPVATVTS